MAESRLLILGAFEPELTPIRTFTGLHDVEFRITGVGPTAAAAATVSAIRDLQPERILFVGSVGALDPGISPLIPICINDVQMLSGDLVSGAAYLPKICVRSHSADGTWIDRMRSRLPADCRFASAYTNFGITGSDALARALASRGELVESLELFGVASACAECAVPWNAVTVVTNTVGAGAHEEWLRCHSAAAKRTAEVILPLLSR